MGLEWLEAQDPNNHITLLHNKRILAPHQNHLLSEYLSTQILGLKCHSAFPICFSSYTQVENQLALKLRGWKRGG